MLGLYVAVDRRELRRLRVAGLLGCAFGPGAPGLAGAPVWLVVCFPTAGLMSFLNRLFADCPASEVLAKHHPKCQAQRRIGGPF